MTTRHRLVAALAALAVVVTACGGDDEDATGGAADPASATSDDPTAVDNTPTTTTPPAGGVGVATTADTGDESGPDATVSPDLPEEIAGEVGAMQVIGDPLPQWGADTTTENDPARGMVAPVLVGQDFDGNPLRVDATAGGPTLVVFLAHWCPHCNNEVPRINELRDAGRFPADLNVVAVSTAIDPTRPNWPPSEWLVDLDWTYPAIADGVDMGAGEFIGTAAYGVGGFPFVTLVGADGTVKARWAGEHEPDEFLELVTSNLD
jgi:cytochrome c biogenesis protein CcmG/thiol:disulfide interchange protein DsbE